MGKIKHGFSGNTEKDFRGTVRAKEHNKLHFEGKE